MNKRSVCVCVLSDTFQVIPRLAYQTSMLLSEYEKLEDSRHRSLYIRLHVLVRLSSDGKQLNIPQIRFLY